MRRRSILPGILGFSDSRILEFFFEHLTGHLVRNAASLLKRCVRSRDYGQAERAISNSQLNALLRLHICPIKQVVYLCPT